MLLVKKTVILSSRGKTVGYVNVIRVADSVGAKVVLKEYADGLYACLRIGNETEAFPLTGEVTERQLSSNFSGSDTISCSIMEGDTTVAAGGKRPPSAAEFLTCLEREKNTIIVAEDTNIMKNQIAEAVNVDEPTDDKQSEELPEDQPTEVEPTSDVRESNEKSKETAKSEGEPRPFQKEKDSQEETTRILNGIADRDFYLSMKDKIDELFVVYPPEKPLEEAIPSSRWVRINYDVLDYYVTGVLVEEGKVVEIVYGVPTTKNVNPPKGLESYCEYFPLKQDAYDGYYFIHQDISSGEIIH